MSYLCPICKGLTEIHLKEIFDDRFGFPESFQILHCRKCKHFFTSPQLQEDEIGSLYERYYARNQEQNLPENIHSPHWLWRWIIGINNVGQYVLSPNAVYSLLDVGSGDCGNLREALSMGFNAVGYDADPISATIGRRHGLEVRTGGAVADVYSGQIFGAIQLNQVVEHYIDPIAQLRQLRENLADHGVLFISTPNSASVFKLLSGRRWINWHVPYHQHHFTRRSIFKTLELSGWKVTRVRTITPLVWVIIQIRRLFERPRRGRVSRLWRGSPPKGARILEVIAILLIFLPVRLIDICRGGDSLVLIARKDTE